MKLKRIIAGAVLLALFFGFLIVFNNFERIPLNNSEGKSYAAARVLKVNDSNAAAGGGYAGAQRAELEILSGQFKGERVSADVKSGYLYGVNCEEGMKVHTVIYESNGSKTVSVTGYYRINAIMAIILIFFAAHVLIGGKKGLMSVLGLVFTFINILWLYMPMIYRGVSPFLAAVITGALTTTVCLLLIGGLCTKTASAVISTILGVTLSGIIAAAFGKMAHITGYNVQEIDELIFIAENTHIQIGGLLFSGILIASIGAVMDVGMSVASAIEEIYNKRPDIGFKELFASGMNVGKDTMGTMSNTLILAFAGNSINTLVMLYAYGYPAMYIMNLYSIGIEIIRGLSGSLAVILTVPIAAALSSWLHTREKAEDKLKKPHEAMSHPFV